MKRDMIPKVSQWPPRWARVSDGTLASLCRLQGLSGWGGEGGEGGGGDGSLAPLDHKFFELFVIMYPPHAPEHGTWHLGEATVWEWEEWRRPAPKK